MAGYKIPTYESQQGLVVPPSQMPYAGGETAGLADKVAAAGNLEDAKGLEQATKTISEIALMHKQALDVTSASRAVVDAAAQLDRDGLTAQDFDAYSQSAKKLVEDIRAGLPSMEAQKIFDRDIRHYTTRSLLTTQHRLFTEGVHKQAAGIIETLDGLARTINDTPTPEVAMALIEDGHTMIERAEAAKLFDPTSALNLKVRFTNKIWMGVAERQAQQDPVNFLQSLQSGEYNAVLEPHQITTLMDRTSQRIKTEDRVDRMAQREQEREGKAQHQQLFQSFLGRFLNSSAEKDNPMQLYQEAAESGIDPALLNRFHKMVIGRVDQQVKQYSGLVLKQLQLPMDISQLIAKKEVHGVNMQAYQEYLNTMSTMKQHIKEGMPADIAGGIVINDLKMRLLKSPISGLMGLSDSQFPPPEGFTGNPNSVEELMSYGTVIQGRASEGLLTPAQELYIQSQLRARLSYLNRQSAAKKPVGRPSAPSAPAPVPPVNIWEATP